MMHTGKSDPNQAGSGGKDDKLNKRENKQRRVKIGELEDIEKI